MRSAEHATAAYDQLAVILRVLCAAGVTPAVIKGAALARFVYAEQGLRPFNDIDLLISWRQRPAVDRALTEAAYVTARSDGGTGGVSGERVYWDPSWRSAPVDVHWHFDEPPVSLRLDYEEILCRAGVETIGREPVLVLSPADTVVALAAHFVKHVWWNAPRLRYLRDIAEVAQRLPVDWNRVVETASRAPMMRSPLRITLSAAVRLVGAPVPADIIHSLAPSRGTYVDRRLADLICGRILYRQTWPFKPFVQVAVMRWLDGDAWKVYPKLAGAVIGLRWRRFTGRRQNLVR